MIQTIAQEALPCDESLSIKKKRIAPSRADLSKCKRISIVTGTHGDELEGQYVCWLIQKRINENPEYLSGIVDIYPAINPIGIDSITRGIPAFDLDMNRMFPGDKNGSMLERVANGIVTDLQESDVCIDIHASNIYLTEIPQVRINTIFEKELVPIAEKINIDLIWVHPSATVLESTLAHSMNAIGVPTLVVEMGVGMRITKSYCEQLTDGIFNLMADLGIWSGSVNPVRKPMTVYDSDPISFLNAERSGLFVADTKHWVNVKKGQKIGDILDPLSGEVLTTVAADCDGVLFTIREYPIVDEGSLIGRILPGRELKL